ncbi:aspartyl protease family protein [Tunturiibacter gelidoferens]|uniref:Aspartyl protease family protein n=1 Tax=Tunturiibacter gelidiferens TaxID=3069689 RepID=A0AAU7YWP2_9BACT
MPSFKFPYSEWSLDITPAFPEGQTVFRPIVGAKLRNESKETDAFFGLVDTGADYCMFPSEFLESLGLNKDKLPSGTASGVATDRTIRFATITLEIDQLGLLRVYAGFSDNLNGQGLGMLGHVGFLDRFRLTSDPQSRVFELEELPNV